MPDLIDTPLGKITVEQVTATRYVVGQMMFDTEAAARAHLRRSSVKVLEDFARWVLMHHGEIPEANVKELLPIIRAVRASGLDYAALAAAMEGGDGA